MIFDPDLVCDPTALLHSVQRLPAGASRDLQLRWGHPQFDSMQRISPQDLHDLWLTFSTGQADPRPAAERLPVANLDDLWLTLGSYQVDPNSTWSQARLTPHLTFPYTSVELFPADDLCLTLGSGQVDPHSTFPTPQSSVFPPV